MSARVIARGTAPSFRKGRADAAISGQLPSRSGRSAPLPCQGALLLPLGPAWPIWIAIFASLPWCTKFTMRAKASRCASFHSPGQLGVMRPSALGQVISTTTMPAPPIAREPRCTMWKSPGTPSAQEYCAIGDTTTRFFSVTPRSV